MQGSTWTWEVMCVKRSKERCLLVLVVVVEALTRLCTKLALGHALINVLNRSEELNILTGQRDKVQA